MSVLPREFFVMYRFVFFVSILAVLSTGSLVTIGNAAPFRCAIQKFSQEFENSEAVFVGSVVSVEKEGNRKTFVFEVARFWKGITSKRVTVSVGENRRYQAIYKEGKTYLVFAKKNEDSGELFDSRCSRSTEIDGTSSNLSDVMKSLGTAKTCIDLEEKEVNEQSK